MARNEFEPLESGVQSYGTFRVNRPSRKIRNFRAGAVALSTFGALLVIVSLVAKNEGEKEFARMQQLGGTYYNVFGDSETPAPTSSSSSSSTPAPTINEAAFKAEIKAEVSSEIDSKLASLKTDLETYVKEAVAAQSKSDRAYTDTKSSENSDTDKSYTDTKLKTADDEAKAYTDKKVTTASDENKDYTDKKSAATLEEAKAYTDKKSVTATDDAKNYADAEISKAGTGHTTYVDTELGKLNATLKEYVDAAAKSAQAYADGKEQGLQTALDKVKADVTAYVDNHKATQAAELATIKKELVDYIDGNIKEAKLAAQESAEQNKQAIEAARAEAEAADKKLAATLVSYVSHRFDTEAITMEQKHKDHVAKVIGDFKTEIEGELQRKIAAANPAGPKSVDVDALKNSLEAYINAKLSGKSDTHVQVKLRGPTPAPTDCNPFGDIDHISFC